MTSLKTRAITGLKWSAFDRFVTQGISFIIAIIIARILSPADYGLLGMIGIFIGISQVFIEAGFGSALIRKLDRTEIDFSTVFYYNIGVSLIFYVLLFVSAPLVAKFYNMPVLIPLTRVVGMNIVIGAFGSIHRTKLNIAIDFKTQAKISLISILITGIAGVFLALHGYGVWALVIQGLASTIITTGLLWHYVNWKPLIKYSWTSFQELFSFGSKLMLAGLLEAIYINIYQLVIGKKYSAADLGYYTRANNLAQFPSLSFTLIFERVSFPVLSEIQEDTPRLATNYRRLLKMSAFIIFPLMTLLIALGEPLIKLLLTDKWIPAIPLMQALCISYMFYPIHSINLNLLKVKGKSDLFLRLEIVKKVMITLIIFFTFSFGVLAICIGMVFTSIIALAINAYYTGKLIQIGFLKQMKDIAPMLLISIFSGAAAFSFSYLLESSLMQLIVGGFAGISVFIGMAFLFRLKELNEIASLVLKRD